MNTQQLTELINALGCTEFPKKLIQAINHYVVAEHFAVFVFDETITPTLACAASAGSDQLAIKAAKLYIGSVFHKHDPNIDRIQQQERKTSAPMVYRLSVDEITDNDYREKIYQKNNLIERASLFNQMDGHWIITNLYRDKSSGYFDNADIHTIKTHASLLFALLGKHLTLLPPAPWKPGAKPTKAALEKLLAQLNASLTPREVQVCARALVGMTNHGIALELGIKTPTVATLRKRAYAKLNICSLNELFALCLANASMINP